LNDFGVGIQKRSPDFGSERAANSCFSSAHHSDKNDGFVQGVAHWPPAFSGHLSAIVCSFVLLSA